MEPGRVYFEKYRIIEAIGHGGTSEVYLAENIRLGNKWAIKKVKMSNGQNLLAEPNLLKDLDHNAIPKIIDIEEDEDYIHIIEEYVDGINLKNYKLQNNYIEVDKIIEWALQLCDVLKYLHNRRPHPIIYRDLKPDNIMLMDGNKIKLVDFGIAREYKEDSENDTVPIGTKGYAAPEQYGIGQSDERTDIFSLGVTLYFLLTGKNLSHPPYKIQPMEQLNTDLEGQLFYIVLKCCEILPDLRFQSVNALEEALLSLSNEADLTAPFDAVQPDNNYNHRVFDASGTSESKSKKLRFNRSKNLPNTALIGGKTMIIGLLGVTNGIGVTHTSIMLAQFLSQKGKVALIELNASGHFTEIGLTIENEKVLTKKHFTYNKTDYFWDIEYGHFLTQYREKYNFILLDLGAYETSVHIEEFIRSDLRIVVGQGMDWKVKEIKQFYDSTRIQDPNHKWYFLMPFMNHKSINGIKTWMKNALYPIPFNMNPFVLEAGTKKTFETLLEKS